MLNNGGLLPKRATLFLFAIIVLLLLFLSITREADHSYRFANYNINELDYDELPYSWDSPVSLEINYPTDDKGVIVFKYAGKEYYHPVEIAQKTLRFLDSYMKTNNSEYLVRAESFAQKLVEISFESKGAIYFPYNFEFNLHGIEEEKMMPPWVSGMAQGQALSVFVRLYKITGRQEYLETSERLFRSFTYLKGENEPWTVYVDEAGYYWIEEYPMEVPTHVLNGFIFGIYGLYDYYLIKKDELSKQYLQASITTIRHYVSQFRNESDVSFYCLKHKIKAKGYHMIHIEQLAMLYKMTGDEYFQIMSNNFYNDYH